MGCGCRNRLRVAVGFVVICVVNKCTSVVRIIGIVIIVNMTLGWSSRQCCRCCGLLGLTNLVFGSEGMNGIIVIDSICIIFKCSGIVIVAIFIIVIAIAISSIDIGILLRLVACVALSERVSDQ